MERFDSAWAKYFRVIPSRCHAETSFGLLVAYENDPDMVIEIDDDTRAISGQDLIEFHQRNLFSEDGRTVRSPSSRWYNTLENLTLSIDEKVFPRGHPYAPECRKKDYVWSKAGGRCVLNMGLWLGCPDLDALTIAYFGGLRGVPHFKSVSLSIPKVIVGHGTYFATCSMNTSFVPEIIPAFYQLYMNHMGVDRFDDIWSGIVLKKITDSLGDRVCLGQPVVNHRKTPRDTFSDLEKELKGIMMNEKFWKIVDEAEVDSRTYADGYAQLVSRISHRIDDRFVDSFHRKFMRKQLQKMRLWTQIVDKIR